MDAKQKGHLSTSNSSSATLEIQNDTESCPTGSPLQVQLADPTKATITMAEQAVLPRQPDGQAQQGGGGVSRDTLPCDDRDRRSGVAFACC